MNPYAVIHDPNSFVTSSGDEYRIIYSSVLQDDGTIDLEPMSREPIQERINSYATVTDMSYILAQLRNGDTSVINRGKPIFGDFTETPKTYAQALQLVIDGRAQFDSLPLSVRSKFDNSFEKWFSTAGTQSWLDAMSMDNQPQPSSGDQSDSSVDDSVD